MQLSTPKHRNESAHRRVLFFFIYPPAFATMSLFVQDLQVVLFFYTIGYQNLMTEAEARGQMCHRIQLHYTSHHEMIWKSLGDEKGPVRSCSPQTKNDKTAYSASYACQTGILYHGWHTVSSLEQNMFACFAFYTFNFACFFLGRRRVVFLDDGSSRRLSTPRSMLPR